MNYVDAKKNLHKIASENENTSWLTSIGTKKKFPFVPKNMKKFQSLFDHFINFSYKINFIKAVKKSTHFQNHYSVL